MATEALPEVAAVAAEADAFAADLAARVAGEPQLRYQGMPSDGDSRAAYAALGEAGWIGLHWPVELGGRGLTALHTVAAEERFGYHWLPLSGYLLSVKTIGNALARFAAPALQERLLPEVAAGRLLFCQGFSEPDAGSDLAALRTTARDAGDRFVVAGRKLWTSSAEWADWIYLAVRTGAGARHRGLSVLVAPLDTPGITVTTHATLGGGTLGEVVLEDVEIPSRPARRTARRRLVGADGHARPRAGDEREGRRGAVAARPARRARRRPRAAGRAAAPARRGRGRARARPPCRGAARRPAAPPRSRARWPSSPSPC